MEPEEHLRALEAAGEAFASVAAAASPGAVVPTCPGWDVGQLIGHLGKVHRWAATVVATPLHERPPFETFDAHVPGRPGELVPWFRDGHARLVDALRNAPPDLDCWSFLAAPTPRAFWCRRQAHETAIHLADLALAAGAGAGAAGWDASPAFAADGVDELLRGWMRGRPPRPDEEEGPTLRVVAADHPLDWQIGFPGRRGVTLAPGPDATHTATCTVRARAADLFLLLWNRRPAGGLEIEGDAAVLERWAEARRV